MATISSIKYKIVSFDEKHAQLHVQYYTDECPDGLFYPIELPVVDGKAPSPADLPAIIMANPPVSELTTAEAHYQKTQELKAKAQSVDWSAISNLIPKVEPPPQPFVIGAQTL